MSTAFSLNNIEVISITRQSYMAELSKLLGFMSAWDRRDTLIKYDALFDEATDEEELIASLGTPTKLAIGLALNYVPSPPPASSPAETHEPDGSVGEFAAEGHPELPAADESGEEEPADTEESAAEVSAAEENVPPAAEDEPEALPQPPKRKVRAFGLIVAILFGLVIGVPVAIVLICVGIPFIAFGAGVVALAVWAAMSMIGLLAMFSDVLIIVGVGLVLCALGLLLVWFGLWVSFELGYLWISGVVLRLGRALTYKKEVAAQ